MHRRNDSTPVRRRRVWAAVLFFWVVAWRSDARTLETCFSPAGKCDLVVVRYLDEAKDRLDVAVFTLSSRRIIDAIIRAHRRGVKVRVIRDRTQSSGKFDLNSELRKAGVPLKIKRGAGGGFMHNKVVVIDGQLVITGSFNFTVGATERNDENLLVLDDVARQFSGDFDRMWAIHDSTATAVTAADSER